MKSFEEILKDRSIKIEELELYRKTQQIYENEQFRKGIITSIAISLMILVMVFAVPGFIQYIGLFIFFIIATFVLFGIWYTNIKKKYVNHIKEELVKTLIKSIDASFHYLPKAFVPKEVFKKSELIKNW